MSVEHLEQPRLGWNVLYVESVERSLAFYQQACNLSVRFCDESGHYAELETGATALALCDRETAAASAGIEVGQSGAPPSANITLVCSDVEAMFRHAVAHGATAVHEPVTKPWGQVCSFVTDPDGHLVEIASAVPA